MPQIVRIVPPGSRRRIRKFAWSDSRMLPWESMSTELGRSRRASFPGPSSPPNERAPVPARFSRTPVARSSRFTLLLCQAAITMRPS